jgi:N-acetylglucosamine kinase
MYYGFDMGGTKIELGVFDDNLRRIWQKRVPTPRDDYRQLLATLCDLTLEADAFCGRRGSVGIGIPGLPNDDDGTLFTANVPAAMGRPLPRDLAALIGREVRVDNDANCFTLSEAWDDEFRRYPTVLGATISPASSAICACRWTRSRCWGVMCLALPAGAAIRVASKITYRAAVSNGCTPISMAGACLPPRSLRIIRRVSRRRWPTSTALWTCWRSAWATC